MRRLVSILTAAAAVIVLTAAPVAARAFPFTSTYDNLSIETPCGFPVEFHSTGRVTGHALFDAQGNFITFNLTNGGNDTFTNPDNGLVVAQRYQLLFKNFNSVDNGDGTFTGDQTVVGSSTWYGPDGEKLLTDHGPITMRSTVRTDPEFEILSVEILFERGSHPDAESGFVLFCQKLAEALEV